MLSQSEIKKKVGAYAADHVQDGMAIGIGSGSTVYFFIEEIGRMVAGGLNLIAVPTSLETDRLCRQWHIPLASLDEIDELDLTVDGADEIDPAWNLIKGGGGALLQEKIVAGNSARLIIIADESKLVPSLGSFPLPVEVIPFGHRQVANKILAIAGCREVTVRARDGELYRTDHHHYILDCLFDKMGDPGSLNTQIHLIPGVVETGLFVNMTSEIIIGYADGTVKAVTDKPGGHPA